MEVLIIGDTHGRLGAMKAIMQIAVEHGYKHAIHLGDFGWWPTTGPNPFVLFVDDFAKQNNLCVWAIDGNHDYPGAHAEDQRGYQYWKYTEDNLWKPGLHWIPRNTLFIIDEKRVAFIGGAVSVDRWWQEDQGTWFPQEMLTDIDVADAQSLGQVDILITHDRLGIPPHFRQIRFSDREMYSLLQQKMRWENIFKVLNPSVHFHGHFHEKYESHDEEWPGCHTIGLAAENTESFVGFNFDTLEIIHPQLNT